MVKKKARNEFVEPVKLALVSQTHIPFYGTLYNSFGVSMWKSTLACANECAPCEVKGSYVVHLCGKYETGFSIGHLL